MSFANLKSRSMDISKLVTAAAEASGQTKTTNKYQDDRKWKPTVDEQGNGYAVIRFLPAAEGQDLPWVRYWDHAFKGPTGQWYIERSLTTLGQNDPVGELNSRLWNSGIEEDKETARRQKRRLHYVTNIQVINDPANPSNNGKAFIYEFGKKIFDKIMDQMQPEFPGETPVNPFDFWGGADFELKIRNVAGYRNYDKSAFDSPSAVSNDDSELETIWKQEHGLAEFLDQKNFKSYEELQQKLMRVLGGLQPDSVAEDVPSASPAAPEVAPAWTPPAATAEPAVATTTSFDDDDESLDFFKKLANE